jgi:hypothetical protein
MTSTVWIERAGNDYRVAWMTATVDKHVVFPTLAEARSYANKKVSKRGMVIEDIRVAS